jgi:predicted transcriptional regulator
MKIKPTTSVRDARKSKRVIGTLARSSSTRTSKEDILISIKPVYMDYIVLRTKDHEFRKYLISHSVQRMWCASFPFRLPHPAAHLRWTCFRLYVSSPVQTLKYIAVIGYGKKPGEIAVEDGMGNADFNARSEDAAYAYEIKELYELREPLPLAHMQSKYGATFPQRFAYVQQAMLDDIGVQEQIRLF